MRTLTYATLFLVGLCGLATPAAAQTAALQKRLAAAQTATCEFTIQSRSNWVGGEAQIAVTPAKLSVAFKDISTEDGVAEASGTFGESGIIVRLAGEYLHFMQPQRDGPMYTTTILARESRPGRLMAVHSRHEYTQIALPGFTSRPEQYIGDCAVEP
jgi:hypothetical protein